MHGTGEIATGAGERRRRALSRVLSTLTLQPQEARPRSGDDAAPVLRFTTSTDGDGRLYGGTTMALAYLGAAATLSDERRLHSMHGVFLRAGRPHRPLRVEGRTLRDGRSFSTCRGAVHQGGVELFDGTFGFRGRESTSPAGGRIGISHSTTAPPEDLPPPEDCPDREQERELRLGPEWLEHPVNAVETRLTDPRQLQPEVRLPPRAVNWVRIPHAEGLDEETRTALLLFATDRALLSTAALPHGILWTRSLAVSLNHSLWLHRSPDLSRWHVFVAESTEAVDGLAVIHLSVFDPGRRLVATAVQEALVQYREAED